MVVGYLAKNIVRFDKIFRLHIKSQSWQFYNNHELHYGDSYKNFMCKITYFTEYNH